MTDTQDNLSGETGADGREKKVQEKPLHEEEGQTIPNVEESAAEGENLKQDEIAEMSPSEDTGKSDSVDYEKADVENLPDPSDEVLAEENSGEKSLPAATPEEIAQAEIDRQEEIRQLSDEELEEDDEHEEVHSDEDEHDKYAHEELELPEYAEYPPEKLISEAEKLLKTESVQKIKEHMDSIRKNMLKQLNDERNEKLKEFIESGGVEIDFEFVQPLRDKFRSIYSEYRTRRQKYYNDLQEKLEENLKIKNHIIEQLKEIVSKDESIGNTFKEFNELQQEWRNTGPVPRSESSDLWRTYHHHVENFYEYIKINKELRDLDFKKNHEVKENIISKAEDLLQKKDPRHAFAKLQRLHKEWKHTGPVEREFREPLWEKFSEITKKIHDEREEYFEELRGKREELIDQKSKLVKQLEDFPFENIKTHSQWQQAIKGVEGIREAFRRLGRINHPANDEIWDKFRAVLRNFNHLKNNFYKELKREQQENLKRKRDLLEIAEKIKDSEDWRETTNELKRIQSEWKKIGHVPRSESDKIWKQFRAACNHFFERLTEHNKDLDKGFEDNYKAKLALMEKLKNFEPAEKQNDSVAQLKEIINEWKETGKVPRDKMGIDNDFNNLLDSQFKAIDLDRQESQRIRFENKVNTLADQGGDRKLGQEREFLYGKLDEAKKELNQLENNINFFTSSNPDSPFIKEAERKINQQREVISSFEEKIKMLNIKIRELNNQES